ncbi:hypothetical protein VaNZ11_001526 [Volvox africanus]|uniref:Uncharacterized protein n=1 Tax=Volvox africanus TaxID=51714 RepID=A0ABQ5RPV1_9CHLO|nr:hypothetical protein VaNZ11_001526 [Volvox africanus]
MEALLSAPEGSLRREASGAFFGPARARSTCSGDVGTESSTTTFDDVDDQQQNSRRITLCKQVLLEATTKYNASPLVDMNSMKNVACRNSGALGPLLSMLAAGQDFSCLVRCLDTLSFLLMDRANRRACHELGGLDVLLDVLHRATDQHILLKGLEALCGLCKHDARDKMALWQHKKKGVLLSMLNSRHGSTIVVETLRTCRNLCFAACSSTRGSISNCGINSLQPVSCTTSTCQDSCAHPHSGSHASLQRQQRVGGSSATAGAPKPVVPHDSHNHNPHGLLQLLEPGLLTVVSGLLHPATDTAVLMKALKLLIAASEVAVSSAAAESSICSGGSSSSPGGPCAPPGANANAGCCGCWRTPVFQLVPLLTHCSDVEVVESALAVMVNLSEHSAYHWLLDASGCIPPLLHLLSHKRCGISQAASCVLSVLAEGGVPRVKLCQDMALLAMMRVLQTNHCVVVTIGVLYMLGRLASFRGSVVRSLKGWGAVQLLNRLMATTRDEDAAEGCRQLLQRLGVKPPPASSSAAAAASASAGALPRKLNLSNAHSSIVVFGNDGVLETAGSAVGGAITGAAIGPGTLMRTISAAATVVTTCAADGRATTASSGVPACNGPFEGPEGCGSTLAVVAVRPRQHSSFRLHAGSGVAAVLLGTVSAKAAAAY